MRKSRESAQDERLKIVRSSAKRPYGAKVNFQVRSAGTFGFVDELCVSLSTGATLVIEPGRSAPWEGGKRFVATLEGFPTATAAEMSGRRFVQSLLWMAVSLDTPLKLNYQSYEPAAVFERSRAKGVQSIGYGDVGWNPKVGVDAIYEAYDVFEEPDPSVLLSMEIFCAAALEVSERTRFLALVSALEPLASTKSLGKEVAEFLEFCTNELRSRRDIDESNKRSLNGRILQLKTESIRQALRRLTQQLLTDDSEALRTVDEAYTLRSEIIHSGIPLNRDVDLDAEAHVISNVIRKMYAKLYKTDLVRAPN